MRLEYLPGNGEEDNLRVNKSAEDGELGTVIPADINPADDELRTNDEVDVDGVVDRETFKEVIDVAGLTALVDVRCDSLPLVP
jgi:hypothetical protein